MRVLTDINGVSVDASNLLALYDAFNPIVTDRVEKFGKSIPSDVEEIVELRDALRHTTALIFAVQSKLGALVFQREQGGLSDQALRDLADEVAIALGAGDEATEEADQQIVMPA